MILIILFIIFIIAVFIYKDDENIIYKLIFIIFVFNFLTIFFKYTKELGNKLEEEQKEKDLLEQEIKKRKMEQDYENYVQEQVSNIVWQVPN